MKCLIYIINTITKEKLIKQEKVFELKLATLQSQYSPLHKLRIYYEKWFEIFKEIIEDRLEKKIGPINYVCGQLSMIHAMRRADTIRIKQLVEDIKKRNTLIKMMKRKIDKLQEGKVNTGAESSRRTIGELKRKLNIQIKGNISELKEIKFVIQSLRDIVEDYKRKLNAKCKVKVLHINKLQKDIEEYKVKIQELEKINTEQTKALLDKSKELDNKNKELIATKSKLKNMQKRLDDILSSHKVDINKKDEELKECRNRISKLEVEEEINLVKQNESLNTAKIRIQELEEDLRKVEEESQILLDKKNEELKSVKLVIENIKKKDTQDNVNELKNALNQSKESIEKKEKELKNVEERVTELEKQNKAVLEYSNSTIEEKDKELKAVQVKLTELQKELEATYDSTQSTLNKKDEELRSVQDKIVFLEKQIKEIAENNQVVLEKNNKEIKAAEIKIMELEKTLKELSVNQSNIEGLKATQTELEKELKEAQLDIGRKSEELKAAEIRNVELEKKFKEVLEQNKIEVMKKEKDDNLKMEELRKKIGELKNSIKSLEEQTGNIKNSLSNKSTKADSIQAKAVKVKKPSDLMKEDDMLENFQEDETCIENLEISLESTKKSENNIKYLKTTIKGLQCKISDLEAINTRLQARYKEHESNTQSLSHKVSELQQENTKLHSEVEQKDKGGASCLDRVMMGRITDLKAKLSDTETKLSLAHKINNEQKAEINSLMIVCKELKLKNAAEKKKVKATFVKLVELIDKLKNVQVSSIDALRNRLEQLVNSGFNLKLLGNIKKALMSYNDRVINLFLSKIKEVNVPNLSQAFEGVEKKVNKLWEIHKEPKESPTEKLKSVRTMITTCVKTIPLK